MCVGRNGPSLSSPVFSIYLPPIDGICAAGGQRRAASIVVTNDLVGPSSCASVSSQTTPVLCRYRLQFVLPPTTTIMTAPSASPPPPHTHTHHTYTCVAVCRACPFVPLTFFWILGLMSWSSSSFVIALFLSLCR
jgi:hypothetical protein